MKPNIKTFGGGFLVIAVGLLLAGMPAAAQPANRAQPASPAAQPAQAQGGVQASIDAFTVSRLIWSTMAALDHANQTGNYSVLRDLGAPSFQANNSAATLAGVFGRIRAAQVDLSYAFNLAPALEFAPSIGANGLLRVKGSFPLRPVSINFDLLFQNVGGQWRVFGLGVQPMVIQASNAGSTNP